ncbi:MAG: dTMP kinase [Thermodesulfovibrionaceae bacterium]
MDRGIFITFEGIEGSGKTTQAKLITERLKNEGFKAIYTYEPGDTKVGSLIRNILLDPSVEINSTCELLLYFADRVQHIEEKIKSYLMDGFTVICDRFTDSTVAYQGYGRGLSLQLILKLNETLLGSFKPDLTVLLDLPAAEGLKRNEKINKKDRFELENLAFHERVRQGYLEIAKFDPKRFIVVDATKDFDEINEEIYRHILWVLKK